MTNKPCLLILTLTCASFCSAQIIGLSGIPAQEPTQLLNHAELVTQIAKQVQHIQLAIQTYNQIMVAGRLLTNMQWSNAQQDLMNLANIVQVGQGLAFSAAQIDAAFTHAYPGFGSPSLRYFVEYQKWSQTTLDTIRGTLRGSSLRYGQLQNQQLYLAYLQAQNGSAAGEMQAISVGNQIGIETVKSLGGLQQLMLANMQSQQASQAYQVQKEMTRQRNEDRFFTPTRANRDGIGW